MVKFSYKKRMPGNTEGGTEPLDKANAKETMN